MHHRRSAGCSCRWSGAQCSCRAACTCGARRRLLQPHAILIIIEVNRVAVLNHVLQLAALAPSVRPSVVLQRIANRVIGDALAIECGQLILPVGVAVSVGIRVHRSAQRAGGISIRLLTQNVAAQIVGIHPKEFQKIFSKAIPHNSLAA